MYGKKVKKLVFNTEEKVTGVELFSSPTETISGENVILCAGAIQTPAIIQRSGIQNGSGEKLRDHIGFTVNYMKFEEQVIEEEYSGNYRFELNQHNIRILNEISGRTIRIAYGTKSNDEENVYDFTEWAKSRRWTSWWAGFYS